MVNSTAITFIIVYILETVFIIIGNSFTIFVFWKQRLHQKRTCFLLINLAVADLLVGISELVGLSTGKFDQMTAVRGKKKKANIFFSALPVFASSTSVFFLALVSLERAYAVLYPLRHRVTNTRVYIYTAVIAWVFGLCTAGLSLVPKYYKKVEERYFILSIHICLFIALLVICTSYIKIRNRLRSTSAEIAPQTNRSTEHNLRLSRTMFIVIAASLMFWLPASVVYTLKDFCYQCFPPLVNSFVKVLHLANSTVNPFVYTFRMPIFKDALKKLLRKRRQNFAVQPARGDGVDLRMLGSFTPQMERRNNTSTTPTHSNTEINVEIQAVAKGGFQVEVFKVNEGENSNPTSGNLNMLRCQSLTDTTAERYPDSHWFPTGPHESAKERTDLVWFIWFLF